MNREVIFRGQRIDNGEWVYGFLYQLPLPSGVGCMILTTDNIHDDNSIEPEYHIAFTLWVDLFLVKPDTIGQFTGLRDKKGKEIFEGDILLWTRKNVHIEGCSIQDFSDQCVIYYDGDKCGFRYRCKFDCGSCVGYLDFSDDRAEEAYIEVIGNIHDNFDLMK